MVCSDNALEGSGVAMLQCRKIIFKTLKKLLTDLEDVPKWHRGAFKRVVTARLIFADELGMVFNALEMNFARSEMITIQYFNSLSPFTRVDGKFNELETLAIRQRKSAGTILHIYINLKCYIVLPKRTKIKFGYCNT